MYSAYGLAIDSELPLPELCRSAAVPDVTIRLGATPESIPDAIVHRTTIEANRSQYLMKFERLGGVRFLVQDGSEVIVEPMSGHSPEVMRLFVLSLGLAAILYQRNTLPLHANAIETGRGAVIIAGDSGAGKSTLSLAFLQRGFRILTDDICALTMEGGPVVQPGIPRLKLWADVLHRLGAPGDERLSGGAGGALERVRPELEKYGVPLADRFCDRPTPIHKIYILEPKLNRELSLRPVSGSAKLDALRQQLFYLQNAELLVARSRWFGWLGKIAGHFETVIATRPADRFCVAELADMIQQDFER